MKTKEVSLLEIVKDIQNRNLQQAKNKIGLTIVEHLNEPEYHNLLGIIAEKEGNVTLAMRHYRASYALDSSYKPAIDNIYRCGDKHRLQFEMNYGIQ